MNANDIIAATVAHSGLSMRAVSLKLKRSENYVSQTIRNGNTPLTDTVAEIAAACGYKIVLRPRDGGRKIVIDPPRK